MRDLRAYPERTTAARRLTTMVALVVLLVAAPHPAWAASARSDKKSPVTTSDAQASYVSRASIRLMASDEGGSGVATTSWRVNRSEWRTGTLVTLSAPGRHTLEFTSTDKAGNEEPVTSVEFAITKPMAGSGARAAAPTGATSDTRRDRSPVRRLLAASAEWLRSVFTFDHWGALLAATAVADPPSASGVTLSAPQLPTAVSYATTVAAHGSLELPDGVDAEKVEVHLRHRSPFGEWEEHGSVAATVDRDGDRLVYWASIRLPERGRWQLRARHAGSGADAESWSEPVEVQSVGDKLIALTFDDGPDPAGTPEVLSALRAYDARATFFLLGWRASKYPGTVRAIARDGHQLGNHRYTHKVSSPLMSSAEFRSEVVRTNEAIERALAARGGGASTGADDADEIALRYPIVFRYPWGNASAGTDAVLGSLQMRPYRWDYGPGDGGNHGPPNSRVRDLIARKVLANARPGSIILLHDSPDRPNTVSAVPIILRELASQGYDFVTVEELGALGW